mgnify:CR=1 FL=1
MHMPMCTGYHLNRLNKSVTVVYHENGRRCSILSECCSKKNKPCCCIKHIASRDPSPKRHIIYLNTDPNTTGVFSWWHSLTLNPQPNTIKLQQLQMPRHRIHHTLGSQNPQHRATPTSNLRPSSIRNHPGAKSQTNRLSLHLLHLLLRLDLQRDLRLTLRFPSSQDAAVGRVRREVFVACECSVGALGGDFTCNIRTISMRFTKNNSSKQQMIAREHNIVKN